MDENTVTGFHSSPISRFLAIAQCGLQYSVAAKGGRVCEEGSCVYSAPSIWLDYRYIFEQSETTRDGRKHVLTYELQLSSDATKRNKKKGVPVSQYVTPAQSVMPLFLYYMVYDSPNSWS